jgi:DNA (cytosine-5)-methyltransferase 1
MTASNTERARAYYNEIDKKAAAVLRELIAQGLIAPGDVDERSITDVEPADLDGYTQCHFFAGVGGWSIAARLAGWPDSREIWSASCPCQPYSVAGKGEGNADPRHLWPDFFRLARARRPAFIVGEQVSAAVGKNWFNGVRSDLAGIAYDGRGVVVPACAVNAPHRRDRLWFVAVSRILEDASGFGSGCAILGGEIQRTGAILPSGRVAGSGGRDCGHVEHADSSPAGRIAGGVLGAQGSAERGVRSEPDGSEDAGSGRVLAYSDGRNSGAERQQRGREQRQQPEDGGDCPRNPECDVADSNCSGRSAGLDHATAGYWSTASAAGRPGAWDGARWLVGHDGKARRVEPSIPLLVDGLPDRASLLRGYGNAIVPQVAAEVIGAYLDCRP